MPKQRAHGDGGLYWSETRQRWIAEITIGYTPAGRRITRKAAGRTKTEAKAKLKEVLRDHEDGLAIAPTNYTVADAVAYWLDNGLPGREAATVEMYRTYARTHLLPELGKRKLRDLSVEDVDQWLQGKTSDLSTRSLKILHNVLNRSVKNAMRRDKVKRNVVDLCEVPEGRAGRNSKALTLAQAEAVLKAAENAQPRIRAYIVISLLSGARTEEVRALRWSHVVACDETTKAWRSVAEIGWDHKEFALYVWRSVRKKGETKTPKSRRSLALPKRCVDALKALKEAQNDDRELVFSTRNGSKMTAHNIRRDFRKVLDSAKLAGKDWAPRELRHSFVSLLSDHDIPIEDISRLVGHSNTVVTETVYRQQIRPVIQEGAIAMDRIFPRADEA
ncbi:site-specific recombinase XerD [Nonomuraea polychroma]|uniref:Site-specific recombinase XerD n=1 Tax=Nonomuraea polychroma TaxID=46176 RepID=A0A438MC89_9ACTN|nr:site-specific integrase [Nonomuraea polychroma]RVX43350.1 site-specific recombinase XerD [Nonomuraea polychroma]